MESVAESSYPVSLEQEEVSLPAASPDPGKTF